MKVKDLIEKLKDYDQESDLIIYDSDSKTVFDAQIKLNILIGGVQIKVVNQ